jgi:hypothetical protein
MFKQMLLLLLLLTLSACGGGGGGSSATTPPVQQVIFAEGSNTAEINLSNLADNDVFVVRVNLSDSDVSASDTGTINNSIENHSIESLPTPYSEVLPQQRRHYDRTIPPIEASHKKAVRAIPPQEGDKKLFWLDHGGYDFRQNEAVLRAVGEYCYVWVATANDGGSGDDQISITQAKDYQLMFDKLYALETNLFGYEEGGGPDGDGGIDGDKKIHILIYDIEFDYYPDSNDFNGTFGVASTADRYSQEDLDALGYSYIRSNEAQIFYIDAFYANVRATMMYKTLAHEFQHMIYDNHKDDENDEHLWLNEMSSLMAENLLFHPSFGLEADDIMEDIYLTQIRNFYVDFNKVSYTDWDETYYQYSKVYVYGAYLVRNYGGARLIKAISNNAYNGEEAIGAALYELYPSQFTTDYKQNAAMVFARFGEAIVYSCANVPDGVHSIDKTVTDTLVGYTYSFPAINIWSYFHEDNLYRGPSIPQNWSNSDIKTYGIVANRAKNISGDYTLTFTKPNDPDILIFVMVKPGSKVATASAEIAIHSAAELNNIRNNLSGNYILMADIDLSAYSAGSGWLPIGDFDGYSFTGKFDGNGYKITNLSINRPTDNDVGLFGAVEQAELRNVSIEGANVTGKNYVGALAGSAVDSLIENNHSTGDVTAMLYAAGGLAGYLEDSRVNNSHNTANITSNDSFAAGIAGVMAGGEVMNSYNTGNVSVTTFYGGGIAGKMVNSNINDSYNTGDTVSINNAGGIAANMSHSSINNSYNTGIVTAEYSAGGLAGFAEESDIANSYNTGNVTVSTSGAGGIAGSIRYSEINNSYSTGNVTAGDSFAGLVGAAEYSDIINSYNTGIIIANTRAGGIVGQGVGVVISGSAAINPSITATIEYAGRIIGRALDVTLSDNYALDSMSVFTSGLLDPADSWISAAEGDFWLKSQYEIMGWQFDGNDAHPWKMPAEGSEYKYPILYWQE